MGTFWGYNVMSREKPHFFARKFKQVCLSVGMVFALMSSPVTAREINIGGGTISGVYYQVAYHTCSLMNEFGGNTDICVGRPSLGSVFNINAVARGMLDFGIAQSDRVWQATNGKGSWRRKAEKRVRTVFNLYPEIVLAVVHKDSDINSIEDFKGQSVNIGNRGSGHLGNALDFLRIYGIDPKKDITAKGMRQDEAGFAFLDRELDGFVYTVGIPNDAIEEVAEEVDIRILDINSPAIKKFVAKRPYYSMVRFNEGLFRGTNAFETYAARAIVVTGERTPDALVYKYVKSVFENLEELKKRHPAFGTLDPAMMINGMGAPLHPGAVKYYREKGLL